MQILVAPVNYMVSRTGRVMILPLQNLLEVVSLRVLDAESLHCLIILRSHVVSDVVVIVLCCSLEGYQYAVYRI